MVKDNFVTNPNGYHSHNDVLKALALVLSPDSGKDKGKVPKNDKTPLKSNFRTKK